MDLKISKKLKKDVIYINIQLNFRLRVKIWDLFYVMSVTFIMKNYELQNALMSYEFLNALFQTTSIQIHSFKLLISK